MVAQAGQALLAAKDGNALVTVGLNYVYEGKQEKGFRLIEHSPGRR